MFNIKIKAAVLEKIKSKLKILYNINIPKLKRGQVLIKIKYAGVCRSQLYEVLGKRGKDLYLPHLLGHEATGVVIACGKDTTKVKPLDKIFLTWIKSDGIEADTPKFNYPKKRKIINSGRVTTFSNYTIASENRVIKLPKKINFKTGVLLGCALPTGAGMIFNQTKINKNSKVLVFGLGGVGLSALLAAMSKKPKLLVGIDKNKYKINILNKFFKGKVKLLNNQMQKHKELKKLKKNRIFDYAIETSGTARGIESCIELLHDKGKCVFASHPPKHEKIKLDPFELIKGKQIEGSWGGQINFKKHLNKLVKIIKNNRKIDKLFFRKEYSLCNINFALNDLKNGNVLRAILRI